MARPDRRTLTLAITAVGLLPAIGLAVGLPLDRLGANPVERITHVTGEWTLRLLVLTLSVTPARRLFGWAWLAPQRRTLGLLAFTYGCLHFATYLGLDLVFDFAVLGEDIAKRPYITVGFASLVLMVPLAATSTRASMKRLGQRWNRLHTLVYASAIGGVLHFLWLVKADMLEPALYGAVVALLLGARLWHRWARA